MRDDAILVLPAPVRRAIAAHARRERPRECCGLLVGRRDVVVHAVGMTNVAKGTTRYTIDPREHIALRRTLRSFSPPLEIVGVYHSHPAGAAEPSHADVAEAHYPEWAYLIVGLAGDRCRFAAFRLGAGSPRRLTLRPAGRRSG